MNFYLRDDDPTLIKFNKLCELAEDLGITLRFKGNNCFIEDRDRVPNSPPIFLRDTEKAYSFDTFPPTTEYMLVHENPEARKKLAEESDQVKQKLLDELK